jgi:hypothetical protein
MQGKKILRKKILRKLNEISERSLCLELPGLFAFPGHRELFELNSMNEEKVFIEIQKAFDVQMNWKIQARFTEIQSLTHQSY